MVPSQEGNLRFPLVRLCPSCNGIVRIDGVRQYCKHVDECPYDNCKAAFCAYCLKIKDPNSDEWPCGGPYEVCPTRAPRQQL